MPYVKALALLFGLLSGLTYAQPLARSLEEPLADLNKAPEAVLSPGNVAIDQGRNLTSFFKKLQRRSEGEDLQLNIVHIGDSHIQAGFMTGAIRDSLQAVFGNAGLGFVFPHRLAKSNGLPFVKYVSSAAWTGKRNLYAQEVDPVGLSGFSLTTAAHDFALNMEVDDERYYFKSLKLFTPSSTPLFELAETNAPITLKNWTTEQKIHRIKSGEALSIIAQKYGVSVAKIKAANNLRSDMIRAGATLKIPVPIQKPEPIDRSQFNMVEGVEMPGYFEFDFDKPLRSVWLLPRAAIDEYALNGMFLENRSPGITYSGIGVNGARFKDYNKTPLFFKQLPYLEPDLLVVSLGTNGAHSHMSTQDYMDELQQFVHKVREVLPQTPIVLTTPSPMLDRRTTPNAYVEKYTQAILAYAQENQIAVWNLFEALGGNQNIRPNYKKGWYFRDYIHYTPKGYAHSGKLFTEALLSAFYQATQKRLVNEL